MATSGGRDPAVGHRSAATAAEEWGSDRRQRPVAGAGGDHRRQEAASASGGSASRKGSQQKLSHAGTGSSWGEQQLATAANSSERQK